MVTIDDCQRVQTEWFVFRAEHLGGSVWHDGGTWVDGPDGMNLMFPEAIDRAAIQRSVRRARNLGRSIVGVWASPDLDGRPLEDEGFTEGWRPCWMTADLSQVPRLDDPRVALRNDTTEYTGVHASYRDTVRLSQVIPHRMFYADAHSDQDGQLCGRAITFLSDALAGIFDMGVWPESQKRRGYGSALVDVLCRAAAAEGGAQAVLNATPEGELLYPTMGFRELGRGRTWWLHLN